MSDSHTQLQIDVGIMKEQITQLGNLCNKMDIVIEKLMDQTSKNVERIYDDMNDREKEQDKTVEEIHNRIDKVLEKFEDSEKRITESFREEIAALRRDLSIKDPRYVESTPLTEKFKEWKYMAIGAAVVFGWLINHLDFATIKKLFNS